MYDLLIKDGLIIDGTGKEGYFADLAIAGERIVEIGSIPEARARRLIPAQGLVVSPGFVDIHSHSDYHLFLNPDAPSSLLQGVTSEVGGNCGYSAAPIFGEAYKERRKLYLDSFGLDPHWQTVNEYFSALESIKPAVNFGLLAGHNTIRASAQGMSDEAPSEEALARMAETVKEAITQGAFGLSTGLIYPPACFCDTAELIFLARACAEGGGIFTVHLRSEGESLLEALAEAIAVARLSEVSLQISHLKTSGEENWAKLDKAFELIEDALASGLEISCDRYPYTASNTGLASLLPKWVLEGNNQEKLNRLNDPSVRERLVAELNANYPNKGYWERIFIAEVSSGKNKGLEGLSLREVAALRQVDEIQALLDIVTEEEFKASCLIHSMSEDNLKRILKKPYVMLGSDSGCRATSGPLAKGKVHPRIFGTFARVLARYVREEGVLDLPTAIRKMTSDPCKKLSIADRGVIKEGYIADLVIFAAEKVIDLATYFNPFQHPEGIDYVLVNGQVAVEAGQATGVRAGKVLRLR